MHVWSLSDLHLSFGTPNKSMEIFGERWKNFEAKIQKNWSSLVKEEDLVLIAGDISWAMNIEQVMPDLEWIHHLPGTKLLLKGNHDYWWPSSSKLKALLPPSIHFIYNNAFDWNDLSFAGSRLWNSSEFSFSHLFSESIGESKEVDEKVFARELERLEISLKALNQNAKKRIALTHYPPIGTDLKPSKASKLLEKYHVELCVFGHLHGLAANPLFGKAGQIQYVLTSADYLNFTPILII